MSNHEQISNPNESGADPFGFQSLVDLPVPPNFQKTEISNAQVSEIRANDAEKKREWELDNKLGINKLKSDLMNIQEAKKSGEDMVVVSHEHFQNEAGEWEEREDILFVDEEQHIQEKLNRLNQYKSSNLLGKLLSKIQEAKAARQRGRTGSKNNRIITE